MPSDSEVWPGVNTEGVTELMTHCPASTGNSYGYNAVCGQKALSTFNNPNHLIVFADATSPSITDVDSIDYRHNHSSVVAYLDGHAKVVSSVMAEELRP